MYTVEIERTRAGHKETESAAFSTIEGAREWARTMHDFYGYKRIWIDGIEFERKEAA